MQQERDQTGRRTAAARHADARVELGLGGITLIVESPLLRMLRDLLGRFIGWSDERRLNLALRSVRMAATHRELLQLCGDDDHSLVAVARTLQLTPYLVALAEGRPGDAPLFVSEASRRWPAGRRWSRHMAYNHVRRIAADAKVPVLPPQALRRTQATLAEDAGETALAVARHLGHATAAARTAPTSAATRFATRRSSGGWLRCGVAATPGAQKQLQKQIAASSMLVSAVHKARRSQHATIASELSVRAGGLEPPRG